jgi:hypothetical protein
VPLNEINIIDRLLHRLPDGKEIYASYSSAFDVRVCIFFKIYVKMKQLTEKGHHVIITVARVIINIKTVKWREKGENEFMQMYFIISSGLVRRRINFMKEQREASERTWKVKHARITERLSLDALNGTDAADVTTCQDYIRITN